jgi:NADH dehydrogenase
MDKNIKRNIPKKQKKRVVVVGGGFAGINFIKRLKGEDLQLILVDKNNYHVFRPLIYQVATAGLEPGAISNSLRGMFYNQHNLHFRMAKAERVDVEKKQLLTSAGKLEYDYLILANGAIGNFFGNDNIKDHSLTINNLQGALAFREKFIKNFEKALLSAGSQKDPLMNVVIVGGGPTGVELAGAVAELKKNVLPKDYPDFNTDHLTIHLIEGLDRILPAMSEESGIKATRYLKDLGVKVQTGKMVEETMKDRIILDDGGEIKSNLLVWAAGVKGNVIDGFGDENTEKGDLIVDEYNRVNGTEHVFAIGDVSAQKTEDFPKGLPNLAPVAIQQGEHLADNIKRLINDKELKPFDYKDKGILATVGRHKALVELAGKIKFGGRLGWLVWVLVHLYSIIGLRRKIIVLAHWIWSYFTYDKGNRLVLNRSYD